MKIRRFIVLILFSFTFIFGCSTYKEYLYIPENINLKYYTDYLKPRIENNYLELTGKEDIKFLIENIELQYRLIDTASLNIANAGSGDYQGQKLVIQENGQYINEVENISRTNATNVSESIDVAFEISNIQYYLMLNRMFIEALNKIDDWYIYPD